MYVTKNMKIIMSMSGRYCILMDEDDKGEFCIFQELQNGMQITSYRFVKKLDIPNLES